MPSQVPTLRTTRNSRGLRASTPIEFKAPALITRTATGRVPKRALSPKAHTTSSITNALAPTIITEQASGSAADALSNIATPSKSPKPVPIATTPEQVFSSTTGAPSKAVSPSEPPQTPVAPTIIAQQTTSPATGALSEAVLAWQSPRVATTSTEAAFTPDIKAPSEVATLITQSSEAPVASQPTTCHIYSVDEAKGFSRRKPLDGEVFARELYHSIRYDHFMRSCQCPLPTIYQSKDEAVRGKGHLRFYLTNSHSTNIRVIQSKNDLRWHCTCQVPSAIDIRYKERFNHNRKRPATSSEFDLIAQVTGRKNASKEASPGPSGADTGGAIPRTRDSATNIERVIQQTDQEPVSRPMWSYIVGYSAAMSAALLNFVGKLIPSLGVSTAHEVVDIRQRSKEQNNIVVKRFKLQHNQPQDSASRARPSVKLADLPDLSWATDPTRWIGLENINQALNYFWDQRHDMDHGAKAIGGAEWATIQSQLQPQHNAVLVAMLHHFLSDQFGAVTDSDPLQERLEKWQAACEHYKIALETLLDFIHNIYMKPEVYEAMQVVYPKPPSPFTIERAEFRLTCRDAAEFLVWIVRLRDIVGLPTQLAETLSKMIADAEAIHKRELLPSWTEFQGHNQMDQTNGPFGSPVDQEMIYDEIPVDDFIVEPTYALRHPTSESPNSKMASGTLNQMRVIPETPKHILKSAKAWTENVQSPRYVAKPKKKRKVAFESPVEVYHPPRKTPAKTMSAWDRMWRDEPLMNEEAMERADDDMHLSYYGGKYTGFLDNLREQAEAGRPKAREASIISAEELEMLRKRQEKMREEMDRKKTLASQRKALEKNLLLTPETKRRAMNELPVDVETPPHIREVMEETLEDRELRHRQARRAARRARKSVSLAKMAQGIHGEEERRDDTDNRHEVIDLMFFDTDDDELPYLYEHGELKMAQKMKTEITLARQLRDDWESAMLFERRAEDERRRQAEQERRRIEEEQRRQEEERRQQEAERRRLEEEAATRSRLRAPVTPIFSGELSQHWTQRLANIRNNSPSAPLCTTLNRNQELHKRDFEEKLLPKTAWLNDDVVDGILLHVADYVNKKAKATRCAALTAAFWKWLQTNGFARSGRMLRAAGITQDTLLNLETVLIPICEDSHWTLAVVRPQARTIAHMDSMRGGHGIARVQEEVVKLVREILKEKWVEGEWRTVDHDAPRQTNGFDCGMFICMNGLCIALGVDPQLGYKAGDLGQLRRRLAAMLLNQGFRGDFSLDHV